MVKGQRVISLNGKSSTEDEIWVEGLKHNLLSVAQLNDRGYPLEFINGICRTFDNKGELAEEVEKLNGEKLNLRRELESLNICMSQELEARIEAEHLIKERDHDITKIKRENATLREHLNSEREEKENMQLDLDLASSLRENMSKHNEDLTKQLTETSEKLDKFFKSSILLEEKIQSQRMKGDISGLGFHTTKKGESSGTMSNNPKNKSSPKINNPTSKVFKPVCFVCHKLGHTANVCRNKPNRNANYNTNASYVSKKFEGHCFTCGMYEHRSIECRYGANNHISHMHPKPNGNYMRNFDIRINMNWQRPPNKLFSPFEMEKVTNIACTICNNFGHVAMNCRRRTG